MFAAHPKKGLLREIPGGGGRAVVAGLGRLPAAPQILHEECDPFYIHTSVQSQRWEHARPGWGGGGARVYNLHIVQCVCI